ncbi:Leucine-rich repeat-containing G-protein coupled receptor 4 [Trichoplax sp. H2]|nr:Leucine-rich repeat-containing G-protein coupled receptor 4 [Trichoplax sp. H2]|eukprot:RDD40170.1 Leucine-rich repeat-containing G-protein coupled receptor 4 [Trichoplax sp. H2]
MNNKISKIDKEVLGVDSIAHTLTLSGNNLNEIPVQLFTNTPRLINLELDRNKIEVIPDFAFVGVSLIEYLNLSNNNISSIVKNTFAGLSHILAL